MTMVICTVLYYKSQRVKLISPNARTWRSRRFFSAISSTNTPSALTFSPTTEKAGAWKRVKTWNAEKRKEEKDERNCAYIRSKIIITSSLISFRRLLNDPGLRDYWRIRDIDGLAFKSHSVRRALWKCTFTVVRLFDRLIYPRELCPLEVSRLAVNYPRSRRDRSLISVLSLFSSIAVPPHADIFTTVLFQLRNSLDWCPYWMSIANLYFYRWNWRTLM